MADLPPDISPEDYSAFVANLRAYFDAQRAATRDGGAADDVQQDSPGPLIEQQLLRLFSGGLPAGLDPRFLDALLESLKALSSEDEQLSSLPGWAEFVARLFRYEQDFLIDLEELDLPERQKSALRRQMVGFFRGLARQLTGHLATGRAPQGLESLLDITGGDPSAALRDERVLPTLLGALREPACVADNEGLVRYANPAFRQLTDGAEPLGTPVARWLRWTGPGHPGDRSRSAELSGHPARAVEVVSIPLGTGAFSTLFLVREEAGAQAGQEHHASDDDLRTENQRLRAIYRAWVTIGIAGSEEELLPSFLRRLGEVVPYAVAAVLLVEGGVARLWSTQTADAASGWEGLGARTLESFGLFAHQPAPTEPPRVIHLGLDGREEAGPLLPPAESLALPLVAGDRVWGVLVLYRQTGSAYTSAEVQAVAILAHGLASVWRQLLTTRALQRTNEHVNQELRFARRVQRNFLPHPTPHPRLRIVTRFVPATALSGDFYLFDQPAEGPVTILIGDVAGHGIPAALMMMTMVGIFSELLPQSRDRFHEILPLANLACCQVLEENYFVTAQAIRIDLEHHEIVLANAGHPPPLHLTADGSHCEYIESSGLPLGMFPDAVYTLKHVPYHPGDRMLLYTDGALEARDRQGRAFGKDRLRLGVLEQHDTPSSFLLDRLVQAAKDHAGREQLVDDLALICVDLLVE